MTHTTGQRRPWSDDLGRPLDEALMRAFVTLPDRLDGLRQTDRSTERALLTGQHLLSPGLKVIPFVVERRGEAVGRCALSWRTDQDHPEAAPCVAHPTMRGDDPPQTPSLAPLAASPTPTEGSAAPRTAQLGFFDCINDQAVAAELFARAADAARELGFTELIGPVDASFWLRYRQKVDHFHDFYFGEPTNPSYYPHLWANAGWEIAHRYVSIFHRAPSAEFPDPLLPKSLARALDRGYRLLPLDMARWDEVFPRVHLLLTRLYARMPLFHPLPLDTFTAVFQGLRRIINPDLVTLAWRDDELVGFSIVLPDYADLPHRRLTPVTLARILWRRSHYRRVVAAYMGATDRGLGPALGGRLLEQARRQGVGGVSSLVGEGIPTSTYAEEFAVERRQYVLWRLAVGE